MVKNFILDVAVFSLLTLGSLYCFQVAFDRANKQTQAPWLAEWNDCYHGSINSNVLIMGSSKAWVQFSPRIIDTVLQVNSYNLGLDGWGFLMQNCRFKVYLEHNAMPKNIIHSVDIFTLCKRPDLYNAKQFVPYLNDPLIRQYTEGYQGSFNRLHYYFPLYKYNNSLKNIGAALLSISHLKDIQSSKYKGYAGMDKEWDNSFETFVKQNPDGVTQQLDPGTIQEFEQYLAFCKQHDINLIMVFSPDYIEGQKMIKNRNEIIARYEQYAAQYHVRFLNYSNDPICSDKSLFYNSQHLNKKGSELFSLKLARDLKGQIK